MVTPRRLFLLVFLASSSGLAATTDPTPPGCMTIQPQVKQCSVSSIGGIGTFDVRVAPPAGLVITFDDVVTGMQPPPGSSYRASFDGKSATVVPIRRDPIPGATVHFDTATVHVTLNLKLAPTADTQILIVDPRKGARDDEVERRVKEATDGLDDRARERADEMLVTEIAERGVESTDTDASPTRHNQVVLRATRIVRVGNRRILLFTIENRSADLLDVKAVRVWAGTDGADREVPHAIFRVHGNTVPTNEERAGAVSLPGLATRGDRLRLRVEFTNPERDVELAGIRQR